jgi:predicted metal-dependent peptidase
MDAVAPAGRTYARASLRGAERDDGVVLCGRRREGWTLHIVLDTSGSMKDTLPKVLGTIASFCDGAGVADVHILQCDVEVTRDDWLEPVRLAEFHIAGFGRSDMSPGLHRLAEDPEVEAVLILTDGYISYPATEPPYSVLWALFQSGDGCHTGFQPPFGEIIFVDP